MCHPSPPPWAQAQRVPIRARAGGGLCIGEPCLLAPTGVRFTVEGRRAGGVPGVMPGVEGAAMGSHGGGAGRCLVWGVTDGGWRVKVKVKCSGDLRTPAYQ